MKICLVLPPSDDVLYANVFGIHLPPTGLAYLAGFLDEAGYEVIIVDMAAQNLGWTEFDRVISAEKPAVVGIYCALTRVEQALKVSEISKRNGAFTVLGGPEPTMNGKVILSNKYVDAVVRGEGELTFLNLVQKVEEKGNLKTVKGISYKDNDRIIVNPTRPLIENLEKLPFPPWNIFPISKYRIFGYVPLLSLASSRGCLLNCDFCAVPQMYQHTWRGRSPENVVDELEYLTSQYNPSIIFFSDDSFMANLKRVEEICDEIQRRKLDFFWLCLARTDISLNLIEKLKKAGCVALLFNLESQMMGNKVIIQTAFKNAKKAKVFGVANLVFGFPGETYSTCLEDLRFITSLNADHAMFFRNICDSDIDLRTLSNIEKEAYRRFYLRKKYFLNHIMQTINNFKPAKKNRRLALVYIRWFLEALAYINQLS